MIIKLQPSQTAMFWDALRHSYMVSQRIPREAQPKAGVELLANLLSGKSEAWIIYSPVEGGKEIHAAVITSIQRNVRGYDVLSVDALYGLRKLTDELAVDAMMQVAKFAKANGCKKVIAGSVSERVKELALLTGFHETYTLLELEV